MSFLRMILLAAYLAGVAAMVFGVAIRFELIAMMGLQARGAATFAIGCFLCALATREVAAILEKPKEQPQVEQAVEQAEARAAGA